MRFLLTFAVLAFSAAAFAQEHKISVQKYELPKYPPIARQARITGDVKLALEIAPDGTVTSVKLLKGHPMLAYGPQEAVKSWRFHCDDCEYGTAFKHEITFTFKIEDQNKRFEPWMQFPSRVLIYTDPVYVVMMNTSTAD